MSDKNATQELPAEIKMMIYEMQQEHFIQIQTLRGIIADILITTATLPPMVQQRAVAVLVSTEPKNYDFE